MTLNQALEEMAKPPTAYNDRGLEDAEQRRWELLAMVLREIALAKGIDLDCEFEE